MYVKKKYESKNEAKAFDFTKVEDDARKYDFGRVLRRLRFFNEWLEKLHEKVGSFEDPVIVTASAGTSGYTYEITSSTSAPIDFSIKCSTNPDVSPMFNGAIYVGGAKYNIRGVADLTDALIEQLQSAIKWEN